MVTDPTYTHTHTHRQDRLKCTVSQLAGAQCKKYPVFCIRLLNWLYSVVEPGIYMYVPWRFVGHYGH